jgi:hypothetical protein
MTPDARHCPDCGTLGILPLSQPHDPNGSIRSPRMLCSTCEREFEATGITWVGAIGPSTPVRPGGLPDEQIHEMAVAMVERLRAAYEAGRS